MRTELETKTILKQQAHQLLQTFSTRAPNEKNYLCKLAKEHYPTLHKTLVAKFNGMAMFSVYADLIVKNVYVGGFDILLFELRKLYLAHIAKHGRLPTDKTVGKFITKLSEKGNS